MSNDELYPLRQTTSYYLSFFLSKARGRKPSYSNHALVHTFVGTSGGLIPIEQFQWALRDRATALRIEAERHETAANAIEIWRQEPIGANTIDGVNKAWELAEQEVVK